MAALEERQAPLLYLASFRSIPCILYNINCIYKHLTRVICSCTIYKHLTYVLYGYIQCIIYNKLYFADVKCISSCRCLRYE